MTGTVHPVMFEVLTLIPAGEALAANEFSAVAMLDLKDVPKRGHLHTATLVSSGGSLTTPAGTLYCFDSDPGIVAHQTELGVGNHCKQLAKFPVAVTDWDKIAGAASIIFTGLFHFERGDGLWFAFRTMAPWAANEVLNVDVVG